MSAPIDSKRGPGRPRIHPLPDPNAPKRPRGRPAGQGRYHVTLAAIRVTEEERERLRAAALELGTTVSELVRIGALRYADDRLRETARLRASRASAE